MPYVIRKVRGKSCYSVRKRDKTGRYLSKCTTLKKAKRQVRLLNAIEHNASFVPRNRGGKTRKNNK
jgi:hypothetical protein